MKNTIILMLVVCLPILAVGFIHDMIVTDGSIIDDVVNCRDSSLVLNAILWILIISIIL